MYCFFIDWNKNSHQKQSMILIFNKKISMISMENFVPIDEKTINRFLSPFHRKKCHLGVLHVKYIFFLSFWFQGTS